MNMHTPQLQQQHKEHTERQARLWAPKKVARLPSPEARNDFEIKIHAQRQRNYELVHELKLMKAERDTANERAEAFSLDLADAHARIIAQAQLLSGIEGIEFEVPEKKPVKVIVADVLKNYPGITWQDIISIRRSRELIRPRHECMYAVYVQRPDLSSPTIGRLFVRDHSVVLWAVKKIAKNKNKAQLNIPANPL